MFDRVFTLSLCVVFAHCSTQFTYWKSVPVLEKDLEAEETTKSELTCSLEATKKKVNLWCFANETCRLSMKLAVQSWDDNLIQDSGIPCKTNVTGIENEKYL